MVSIVFSQWVKKLGTMVEYRREGPDTKFLLQRQLRAPIPGGPGHTYVVETSRRGGMWRQKGKVCKEAAIG